MVVPAHQPLEQVVQVPLSGVGAALAVRVSVGREEPVQRPEHTVKSPSMPSSTIHRSSARAVSAYPLRRVLRNRRPDDARLELALCRSPDRYGAGAGGAVKAFPATRVPSGMTVARAGRRSLLLPTRVPSSAS